MRLRFRKGFYGLSIPLLAIFCTYRLFSKDYSTYTSPREVAEDPLRRWDPLRAESTGNARHESGNPSPTGVTIYKEEQNKKINDRDIDNGIYPQYRTTPESSRKQETIIHDEIQKLKERDLENRVSLEHRTIPKRLQETTIHDEVQKIKDTNLDNGIYSEDKTTTSSGKQETIHDEVQNVKDRNLDNGTYSEDRTTPANSGKQETIHDEVQNVKDRNIDNGTYSEDRTTPANSGKQETMHDEVQKVKDRNLDDEIYPKDITTASSFNATTHDKVQKVEGRDNNENGVSVMYSTTAKSSRLQEATIRDELQKIKDGNTEHGASPESWTTPTSVGQRGTVMRDELQKIKDENEKHKEKNSSQSLGKQQETMHDVLQLIKDRDGESSYIFQILSGQLQSKLSQQINELDQESLKEHLKNMYNITEKSEHIGQGEMDSHHDRPQEEEHCIYQNMSKAAIQNWLRNGTYVKNGTNVGLPAEDKAVFTEDVACEIYNEAAEALRGGPMDYLPEYRNPCWMVNFTALAKDRWYSGPYSNDMRTLNYITQTKIKNGDTVKLRCLPLVYIVGVTKSGTTDLYANLMKHPDVQEPILKEPMWWNRMTLGSNLSQNRPTFRQYVDLFDGAAERMLQDNINGTNNNLTVDGTPAYLWDYDGWEKIIGNEGLQEPRYILAHAIKKLVPNAKIIAILRDPTERLYSSFLMKQSRLYAEDFHQQVVEALDEFQSCLLWHSLRHCTYKADYRHDQAYRSVYTVSMGSKPYIRHGRYNKKIKKRQNQSNVELHMPSGTISLGDRKRQYHHRAQSALFLRASLYSVYVEDWLKVFPRDQFMIIRAEDYYANRTSALQEVFEFLDLDPISDDILHKIERSRVHNSRHDHPERKPGKMLDKTKKILDFFFKPFNQRLAKLLNDDRFLWQQSN